MSPPGQIVTFYSYKGGVGRSFALANVAVALAAWGYRVLCIDWDLEAPGLGHYFGQQTPPAGLVELIGALGASAPAGPEPTAVPDWRPYVNTVQPASGVRLDLMSAGRGGAEYVAELQRLRWDTLYEEQGLDRALEAWREGWRAAYDYVLIDSRTGITDAGAVCTAHLPDLLVVMFTANRQSVAGCLDVVARAHAARRRLPYDRPALHILPVPSRFDAKEEYRRAQEWQAHFAEQFGPLIASWKEDKVVAGDIVARVTIPYVAYWSFGEGLPVLEEPARDPGTVRFALETIAALVAQRLANTHALLEGAEGYMQAAVRAAKRRGGFEFDVLLACTPDLAALAQQIQPALEQHGLRVVLRSGTEGGPPDAAEAQHAVFLVGRQYSPFVDAELKRLTKQMVDEAERRFVLPVVFSEAALPNMPAFMRRSALRLELPTEAMAVAARIAAELGAAPPAPSPASSAAREGTAAALAASSAAAPPHSPQPAAPPESAEAVVARQRLASGSANVRRAAAAALGRVGSRHHIQPLAQRLADEDERVRAEARRAIEAIAARERQADANFRIDEAAIPTPPGPFDQAAVGEVLISLGDPRGLDLLVSLLDHADERVRAQVAQGLSASSAPAAADWLGALVDDPSPEVFYAALLGKAKISQRIPVEILRGRLPPWRLEEFAQAVANAIPEPGPMLFSELSGQLGTWEADQLVKALVQGRAGEAVREWLLAEMQRGTPEEALAAAELLAQAHEPRLLAPLQARLASAGPGFRAAAARLLGRLRDAAPLLQALMDDKFSEVRAAAATTLGELGSGSGAEPVLLAALGDSSAEVRQAALGALQRVAGQQAAAVARQHLDDSDSGVRTAAVNALAAATVPEDLDRLVPMVADKDSKVRRALAGALGTLADGAGGRALAVLVDDPDAEVRRAAVGGMAAAAKLPAVDRRLLSVNADGSSPWIDAHEALSPAWVKKAAKAADIPPERVTERLAELSTLLGRKLIISAAK